MIRDAEFWIQKLCLRKHPEGGYFSELYRALGTIPQAGLPERYSGDRAFGTSIYYLLPAGEFSAFHRIKSDELWHFYQGVPLTLWVIQKDGSLQPEILGPEIDQGQALQILIPGETWFAASASPEGFTLAGCTVMPGFQFEDFEMGKRASLIEQFPQHADKIKELTRG